MKGTVDPLICEPLLELIIHTVLIHFGLPICMGLLKMLACRYALMASIILKLITCVVNNPARTRSIISHRNIHALLR